jgi:cellulose synthase/poly-beta-1,6-N-acetylglucosamine synthase-like glycosyltransferase
VPDEAFVSIVLPTYNGSRFLSAAIQSCLDQTFRNWELIVVDDASTDQSPEIIAAYRAKDSRIRSVRHETNKKLPAAQRTVEILSRDAQGAVLFSVAQASLLEADDRHRGSQPDLKSLGRFLEEGSCGS